MQRVAAVFALAFSVSACAHETVPAHPILGPDSLAPRDQAIGWWLTTSGFVLGAVGGSSAALAAYAPPNDNNLRNIEWAAGAALGALGLAALGIGMVFVSSKDVGPCEADGTAFQSNYGPSSGPASGPASGPRSKPASSPADRPESQPARTVTGTVASLSGL